MTSYTTIKQRERHATADRLIGQTYEAIQRSMAAQAVLGAEFLDHFHRFACNYYVPNERNGVYIPSRTAIRKDAHPIIVPNRSDRYRVDEAFADISEEQYARAHAVAPQFGIPRRKLDRILSKTLRTARLYCSEALSSPDVGGYYAQVITFLPGLHSAPDNTLLVTRPLMVVPNNTNLSAYTILHEITHHWLDTTMPIVNVGEDKFGHKWRNLFQEYNAYDVQSRLLGRLDSDPTEFDLDSPRRAKLADFILRYSHLLEEWRDPIDEFNFNACRPGLGETALVGGNWYQLP